MISRYSEIITNWLIDSGVIDKKDYELYFYGSYSLLISISPLFLTLIIGAFMGLIINGLLIITPFMLVRKYSGGYHANSPKTCLLFSILLLVMCIWLSDNISCKDLVIFFLFANFILMIISPVDSQNYRLDEKQKKQYRKIVFRLLITLDIVIVGLYIFQIYTAVICISLGIILSAFLQIPYFGSKLIERLQVSQF